MNCTFLTVSSFKHSRGSESQSDTEWHKQGLLMCSVCRFQAAGRDGLHLDLTFLLFSQVPGTSDNLLVSKNSVYKQTDWCHQGRTFHWARLSFTEDRVCQRCRMTHQLKVLPQQLWKMGVPSQPTVHHVCHKAVPKNSNSSLFIFCPHHNKFLWHN